MSKQASAIRQDRALLCGVFDALSDGVVICDRTGAIIELNETACALFATPRAAMLGRILGQFAIDTPADPVAWLAQAEPGAVTTVEWHCQATGGHRFWAEIALRRIELAGQDAGLAIIRDISERKRVHDALVRATRRDMLTGLPNRHDFDEILSQEIARYERYGGYLCLALGHIDELKTGAESLGRDGRNTMLAAVAAFLRNRFRKSDYLARFSDGEFAVLIHDARPDNAVRLLNRLRAALRNETILAVDCPVNMSFGLTAYRLHDTPDDILTRLGEALALTEKAGHHRVVTA